MIHPELTWYKIMVLIAAGMGLGVGVTNMVYFNKIRLEGECGPVSTSTANVMLWLNLFLVVFSAVVFFWSLFRLIFHGEDVDKVNQSFNLHTHIHSEQDVDTIPVLTSNLSPVEIKDSKLYSV